MRIKHHNCASEWFIDGEKVSESAFKRRYAQALEAENEALHAKLAAIYDLL
ncbi:hypothetical protein [Bifidobacterium pseudolongum]|uniref:hypothetical protein n=1 Tax=Bifidobacterium pseudolongum TaxID=1694 RepID=UPI0013EBBF31|nr:hypothetical protein [Bifidobacterium pseudolongum]